MIFCSAYDKWAFTLKEFALMYSVKLGFNAKKLCSYLWGYYYFNPKNKQITKKPPSPNT